MIRQKERYIYFQSSVNQIMFCAISGEPPREPVVSRTTGHLFEKSLIEKHISIYGTCPISQISMQITDLIPMKVSKVAKPRQSSNMSVPGLLSTLQNEWDELILESFTLKQSLDNALLELSQALYQHDAACRVIARLMKERDDARAEIAYMSSIIPPGGGSSSSSSSSSSHMDVSSSASDNVLSMVEEGLEKAVLDEITAKSESLLASRKKRATPAELCSKESFKNGTSTVQSLAPHKTDKPAIYSAALSADSTSARVITGGADRDAVVSDYHSGRVIHKLSGHSKKVTSVAYHVDPTADIQFTGSADKLIKVWKSGSEVLNFNVHSGEVSSISVHPTGNYITSMSHDGSWTILDVSGHQSRLLRKVSPREAGASLQFTDIDGNQVTRSSHALLCGRFHPDGILLSTGSADAAQGLQFWDIRAAEQKSVLQLKDHNSSVFDISFCENGYLLASAGGDGTVKVWDLRKGTCLKSIGGSQSAMMPSRVSWDHSGVYLASSFTNLNTGVASVQVCAVKEYVNLLPEESALHTKAITSLLWADNANTLITSSLDRTLKVHKVNK